MGAYSPAPVVSDEIHQKVIQQVIRPTIDGMAAEGNSYTGFLYAGLMISPDGELKVLEYNCRFGDPETQPILMRLQSDIVELCNAALDRELDQYTAQWDERVAIGIVLAAGGYPAAYQQGDVISGLDSVSGDDCKVFHAGTAQSAGNIVTKGGRVLCVVALGESVTQAQKKAYEGVAGIQWKGVYFRSDIGYRAIAREANTV